jgi:hypothetical protein
MVTNKTTAIHDVVRHLVFRIFRLRLESLAKLAASM